eukprot:CAMPEP_0172550174 /NCGR_PEP_ID=MMETSP1067-20121228/26311_1 /TAXON_ID=265564 ORGANISM="Thalassiosira punctigera, Strain Tpunct2005C2" /NCGR_SAMPLE_ID=MMETSP1067 /ASSEMBLY_ACC=CAM_ASM_000444 /LENGTH=217 /DNA_ID=CAMNT_0013337675 /DNA_START=44 /DNA_END=694 /DNA_ORIENTATION=+
MTIKIEQEAIIRAIDTARSSLQCHPHSPLKPPLLAGGLLRPSYSEPPSPAPYVAVVPKTADDVFCPELVPLDSDEDCISLSSCSTASFCSGRTGERRVSFAVPLVTEVRTRPRTRVCDKKLLYYTQSETDRFRQVYREERQSLSSLDEKAGSLDKEPPSSENSCRRRISRVVVEHNDSLATFYDFDDLSPYSLENGGASMNDVFFDNDSFWSGSITW